MVRFVIMIISVLIIFSSCKQEQNTLFNKVNAEKSGIHFNNIIDDDDSLNILDVENIYNGGGVGVGDFNNDGLQDLYFTGNTVSSRMNAPIIIRNPSPSHCPI